MMRTICDICGKEIPVDGDWGRARLEMTDNWAYTMTDTPLKIGWDLCRPCAKKLYKGLLDTKKALQALEGME